MIKNSPSLGEGVASDFAENQAIVFSMYFKSRNAQPFTMKRRIKGIAAAIAAFSVLAVGSPIVASAQSAGVPNAVDITNQIRNEIPILPRRQKNSLMVPLTRWPPGLSTKRTKKPRRPRIGQKPSG